MANPKPNAFPELVDGKPAGWKRRRKDIEGKRSQPENALRIVEELIYRDVKAIRRMCADSGPTKVLPAWRHMDRETSDKLVKYAGALINIITEKDKMLARSKKSLEHLDTEKLIELYNEQQELAKVNKAKQKETKAATETMLEELEAMKEGKLPDDAT